MARRRAVAPAVVGRAEMRAALHHLARNAELRLAGVIALLLADAARVGGNAAALLGGGMLVRIPIGRPFPDIADHVVEAIVIGGVCADGRGAREAVLGEVLPGELALPGIGHVVAIGDERVTPGEFLALQPAARCAVPLALGGQRLAGPCSIGFGILIGDVNCRMVLDALERAVRPVGVAPVGPDHEGPPVGIIGQIDRMAGRGEHHGAGLQHLGQDAGIVLRVRCDLGEGDIARGIHEALELAVGHRRRVDPEPSTRTACAGFSSG